MLRISEIITLSKCFISNLNEEYTLFMEIGGRPVITLFITCRDAVCLFRFERYKAHKSSKTWSTSITFIFQLFEYVSFQNKPDGQEWHWGRGESGKYEICHCLFYYSPMYGDSNTTPFSSQLPSSGHFGWILIQTQVWHPCIQWTV